jgi:hypothetical protein
MRRHVLCSFRARDMGLLVKVGDLVRLTSENEIGIILTVKEPEDYKLEASKGLIVDDMFPYHVHFTDGAEDWFQKDSLEVISESR